MSLTRMSRPDAQVLPLRRVADSSTVRPAGAPSDHYPMFGDGYPMGRDGYPAGPDGFGPDEDSVAPDDRDTTTVAPAIVLDAVSKRFGRRRRAVDALREVSVVVPAGSLTAVMGLSGSGKSTLLQIAAGLEQPSAGSVTLGATQLGRLRRRKLTVLRRRRVGFVFQGFNLVPTLTVAENIALPLRLDHQWVDRERIARLAELVGIAGQLRRLPGTLSGGQQQRVAIARALITHPDVIFADEPTAALDPYTSETVINLFRAAVDRLGQTVVIVTHEPQVGAVADRALLLDRGRLSGDLAAPGAGELAARLRHFGAVAR